MDIIDIKLLSAMEKNSRISLKNLAKELDVKTSTIYHRLHKLKESNILEKFTIVVNPEEIGLNLHKLIHIKLKKMVIGKLDAMFLESFAKFLSDQYHEILFSSVGDDNLIHIIASFKDSVHYDEFEVTLEENPYIENFSSVIFSKILKGKKIFSFNESQHIIKEEKGTIFDDNLEDSKEKTVTDTLSVQF